MKYMKYIKIMYNANDMASSENVTAENYII